jgi:hypothetical protein
MINLKKKNLKPSDSINPILLYILESDEITREDSFIEEITWEPFILIVLLIVCFLLTGIVF